MFSSIFHLVLYKPLFNLFIGLYNVLPAHDLGLVILVVTIITRIVLFPLTNSSIKAQKSMQELQPKLDAIRKEFANDKQKQAQATMDLYKNNKINPLASCLPLLIQLPILIAIFVVMRDGLASKNITETLYPFISNPGQLNTMSFGILDLTKRSIPLAVLAGLAQFLQTKMFSTKTPPKEAGESSKDENMAAAMNKQMLYVMPVMTVIIGFSLPAGLTLYWFFSTLLMLAQQWFVFRKNIAQQPAA